MLSPVLVKVIVKRVAAPSAPFLRTGLSGSSSPGSVVYVAPSASASASAPRPAGAPSMPSPPVTVPGPTILTTPFEAVKTSALVPSSPAPAPAVPVIEKPLSLTVRLVNASGAVAVAATSFVSERSTDTPAGYFAATSSKSSTL